MYEISAMWKLTPNLTKNPREFAIIVTSFYKLGNGVHLTSP